MWHHVDETERRAWQNPEEILNTASLKAGFTSVDIGCGQGYFTLPAARIVGFSGKVYGLDVDNMGIEKLRKRASTEKLTNIELITGAAEDTPVCSGCADMVFFGIVLHDFNDPAKVLRNARKMLKPGAKLVNLDWKKETMNMGPPLAKRFDKETASRLIESAGFKIETVQNLGQFIYLIIARLV